MKIEDLNLKHSITKAINELGFTDLTEIQEKCIPEILKGKDIFGQSSTGSGKTAAFGVPILEKIEGHKGIQALVLTPTRELCCQVTDAIRSFSRHLEFRITSVYGGVGIEPQIDHLKRADIVIGTPGRILDHINRRTIDLRNVKFFVLDEADKMFEMGFIDDVEKIMKNISENRQTLLFSATLPSGVNHLIKKHLKSPITIKSQIHVDKKLLKQVYYDLKSNIKFSLLVHLINKNPEGLAIVFCGTRREVDLLSTNLNAQKINAIAIHGGLTQNRRLHAIEILKGKKGAVLVATDVAARGLDIKNVSHVYNYDVPKTSEDYIHRIGRTARAGNEGDAVTLLTERDHENFRRVLSDRTLQIHKEEIPQLENIKFERFNDQRRHSGTSYREHGSREGYRGSRGGDSRGDRRDPRDRDNRSRSSSHAPRKRWNN